MNSSSRRSARAVIAVLVLGVSLLAAASPASAAGPPAPGALKINEVESNGGTPDDWIELVNTGLADAEEP